MKQLASLMATILLCGGVSNATDWIRPDPITYEWTVKMTHAKSPGVDFRDVSVKQVIEWLGDSMNFPIGLRHNLPDSALDKRVNITLTDAPWIDIVAKIADVVDAEILIGKGVVTLKQVNPVEQVADDQLPARAESEAE